MKVEVLLADNTNGYIIKNMYPLYLHDLAGIHGTLPNKHGIFEDEDDIDTLGKHTEVFQEWFDHPGLLMPYMITVDERPAGFVLVATGKYVQKGIDFFIYETFLLSPYRGKNISYEALMKIFPKHHGKWMLYTHSTDNNVRAQKFWNKTLTAYTNANYQVKKDTIEGQPKYVFTFEK